VGTDVGRNVGLADGVRVGDPVGKAVQSDMVGNLVGLADGDVVGVPEGLAVARHS
jgi:hypothetical protein